MSYDVEAELEAIHERVGRWAEDFARSPHFASLTPTQQNKAMAVIHYFTDYSSKHLGLSPEQWDPGGVTECCVEIMPRKITAEFPLFHSIAPVLSAFFTYLGEKSLLANAKALAETVTALRNDIVTAAEDPRCWGPAKSFAMEAMKAGVDPCDQGAMYGFMAKYNERILAQLEAKSHAPAPPPSAPLPTASQPPRHAQPKVGRNDPCPCGSAKKYKKCCGAAR
jgi:hypothetical protein